jgi:hypothetical protein
MNDPYSISANSLRCPNCGKSVEEGLTHSCGYTGAGDVVTVGYKQDSEILEVLKRMEILLGKLVDKFIRGY